MAQIEEFETRAEAERFAANLRVRGFNPRVRTCGGLTFDDFDVYEVSWKKES